MCPNGREDAEEDCDAALAAMSAGDPDLDPVWGLLVDDVAEDCDAALAAMRGGDPDLDPVWGLLVGDVAEERPAGGDATRPSSLEAAAGFHAERAFTRRGGGELGHWAAAELLPGKGGEEAKSEEPGAVVSPLEELAAPALSRRMAGGAVTTEFRRPISNVVDKMEVSSDRFRLEGCSPAVSSTVPAAKVVRWEVQGCDAFVLDNVLSKEECDSLIAQAEGLWSFWDDSDEPRMAFRNAFTIEVGHEGIADLIWARVSHLVNPSLSFWDEDDSRFEIDIEGEWVPYAVNPRLLLSRYRDGGHFSPHTDGTTVVDINRRTFYSCVLFLNESPEGGHTRIYADEQMRRELVPDSEGRLTGDPALVLEAVPPKTGRMLCFYHRLMHEGVPASEKYIIRTDFLYRRVPEICTAPEDVEAFKLYEEAQLRAEKGECEAAAALFRRAFKTSEALRKVYRC